MAEDKPIIVDTNVVFSALMGQPSHFTDLLLGSDYRFYVCELVIVELFNHKEKLKAASRLPEDQIVRVLYTLMRHLNLFKEDLIAPVNRQSAFLLCRDIDETDAPHVALTLELRGLLWTGDKALKAGLRRKGFKDFFEPSEFAAGRK